MLTAGFIKSSEWVIFRRFEADLKQVKSALDHKMVVIWSQAIF